MVVGISLGVLPAMKAAQTNDRVVGAFFIDGAAPLGFFAEEWPDGVSLEVHGQADDPWFAEDRGAADDLVEVSSGRSVVHDGAGHLALDPDAPDHDPVLAAEVTKDLLAFLDRLDHGDGG